MSKVIRLNGTPLPTSTRFEEPAPRRAEARRQRVLVVMHYPTDLFADAADHTYVKCEGGGRAWACWGGKTGGKELRRATGSTQRADAIAERDEKASITCYLINGVCHQAANRILLP